MGWVTPLYAAILMPVSSLTIVTLAVLGGKKHEYLNPDCADGYPDICGICGSFSVGGQKWPV